MKPLIETYLYQEIHDQPQVIQGLLDHERAAIKQLAEVVRAKQLQHVVIAARGTSDNAARYAQYLLGAVNRIVVTLATPSLFSIYEQPPRFGKALVLGISQSGKSPDIVAVLAEARRQGAVTAAITNFAESDLAQQADHVINLRAGVEQSVAATKTYTSELAVIALLSATLASDAEMLDALARLPQALAETLTMNGDVAQTVERYRYMQHCVVIGRGYNYATAFELALKLKELTYTIVEPYSSADFMHGPLALIDRGFPVIIIAPQGRVLPEMMTFADTLQTHGAETVVISNQASMLTQGRVSLRLPDVSEWLSPLLTIVPGQLFAMHLAHTRDYAVDTPRAIQKVTETQ